MDDVLTSASVFWVMVVVVWIVFKIADSIRNDPETVLDVILKLAGFALTVASCGYIYWRCR